MIPLSFFKRKNDGISTIHVPATLVKGSEIQAVYSKEGKRCNTIAVKKIQLSFDN